MRVREGKWSFDAEAFAEISTEAKDFISKLLERDPKCVQFTHWVTSAFR